MKRNFGMGFNGMGKRNPMKRNLIAWEKEISVCLQKC
jgi:hypothetical protein